MTTSVSNLGFLQELEFRRNADLEVIVTLQNNDGSKYDATGCEVRATIKARSGEGQWDFVADQIDSAGVTTIRLLEAVASQIPASPVSKMAAPIYDWFVDVKLANGLIVPFCYGPAYARDGGSSWS